MIIFAIRCDGCRDKSVAYSRLNLFTLSEGLDIYQQSAANHSRLKILPMTLGDEI